MIGGRLVPACLARERCRILLNNICEVSANNSTSQVPLAALSTCHW
ncbi:hypothetical protein X949_5969 [Burkholderia pseudomallei MSHR5609]|nr:hypothetical protein X949_5969 [Burkholderia pseudomallei MSHR5609]